MATEKPYLPLKIGLLIVAASYFLFTAHGLFTLQWIGEWNRIGGGLFSFDILVEDISATVGLVFRFVASLIAVSSVVFYFSKDLPSRQIFRILRYILVFEGIYWLGLFATTIISVQALQRVSLSNTSVVLNYLALTIIPSLLESLILPIALFILAIKLNPNKPKNRPIKWAFIAGTILIAVFWLINSSMWLGTWTSKGTAYLISYPENLLSFLLTIFGLLALTVFSAYLTIKFRGAESLQGVRLRLIGVAILALGLYFLWNYLTWIFFGGDYLWSDWYAWFLGHNMDLWMLSLPLLGLPLLFIDKLSKETVPS